MPNSSPGKDRLECRHLRLLDPKCEILSKMFRHCFIAKYVPTEWKTATTFPIHKKEDTSDAINFRPIALMSCLYKLLITNSYITTAVVTPLGKTPSIPIHSGVKQGCPLSAILFNLAVELIIRKCNAKARSLSRGPLKHHHSPISILAYAGDIVILACNKDSLQSLLDAVSSAANSLQLQFRPDKCASLSMAKKAPRIELNNFFIQGNPISALNREDHYRYIGVPIGLIPNISIFTS